MRNQHAQICSGCTVNARPRLRCLDCSRSSRRRSGGGHHLNFFFFFCLKASAVGAENRRQRDSGPLVPVYHDSCSEAGCHNRAPAWMAAASRSELLRMLAE